MISFPTDKRVLLLTFSDQFKFIVLRSLQVSCSVAAVSFSVVS